MELCSALQIPNNQPSILFSDRCHPQSVKQCKENPLSCHPFPLKLLPTCEHMGLPSHLGPRNSQAHSSAPNLHPRHSPSYSHSRTPAAPRRSPTTPQTLPQCTHTHPRRTPNHTPDIPPTPPPSAPTLPPHPQPHLDAPSLRTHTPSPPQSRMQFPNRSDSATQSDTNKQASQRELHAKLQHLRPLAGPVATRYGGHRAQAATHPDR